MEIPALGHFLSRRDEKRLLASVRSELDRAGTDSVLLSQPDATIKAARSSDGNVLRLEVERPDGARLLLSQHHFERESVRHYGTHDRRGWGGSSSGHDRAPWRPWLTWLLGQSVPARTSSKLPFQSADLKALAAGQTELAAHVAHQAWTAWREHDESPRLEDGRFSLRASQTEDGASFQAEIVELESGQRVQLAQDFFSTSASFYLAAGKHSFQNREDFRQPLAPEEAPALRNLLSSANALMTRRALEVVRAGLREGEDLEQATACYSPLIERPWPAGVHDACGRVEALVQRGVERSTAVRVLLAAGTPDKLAQLGGLEDQAACAEFVRDPLRWEARRLGESMQPAGATVRESPELVQLGAVSLRKREG